MHRYFARYGIGGVLISALLLSCATVPYTGRSQMIMVSEGQELSLGEDAYRHILRDSVVTRDPRAEAIVRRVGERIAHAAAKPDYRWEFSIINDPETVNAFAVPGGKVAVYTGIFKVAQDETGLAVVLGHEVAHALARHPAERMTQGMLLQLGGVGLGVALGRDPALANQVLQAYGIGTGVGLALPFGRAQETEADRIGLILMAKAGYDPRAALAVWQRMERQDGGKTATPEFLSTHPGYQTRIEQLRSFLPEAMGHFVGRQNTGARLPLPESLDSQAARSERELLKRIAAFNHYVAEQGGERAVAEALAIELRLPLQTVVRERQQLEIGYGQYAALRGIAHLGRGVIQGIADDYRRGRSWFEIADFHGSRLDEVIRWLDQLVRVTNDRARLVRGQTTRPPSRLRR